ncbi:MAG: TonB family protein [Candidatus Solibacter sp.]|nr:TonB family protein [Candidatus Solibacter sp.]
MNNHLSEQGVFMYLIGTASLEDRKHGEECADCQAKIAALALPLSSFRGAVRNWSERAATAKDRAAELRWTVIPATDHLERLLLPPTLDVPWHRSLWSGLRDLFRPLPPLDVTSKPVLVSNIWGQYGRQKKSFVMSIAIQSAAAALVFAAALTPTVRQKITGNTTTLIAPDISAYEPKAPARKTLAQGGGGGGDHSPLPPSKGRAPKFAPRQFTPPSAVLANLNPKLTMDPTLIGPPDLQPPNVNMTQFGDPLAKLGPASNGPGSGGGIGTGSGGGVGPGKGGGLGPGEGGGIGGGVFRTGGGVTAPSLVSKVEPEYSEEARKAKYQGSVLLYVEVDANGRAQNIRVLHSLGLGLDEKAIEAVKRWKFRPGTKDGRPVTVAAQVEVNFRLL